MKKYLMTGVAALALCAGFTACSSDEDFSFNENEYVESQKALIEAKYQQAFVNAFGQPAKNHTWGFGNYATRGVNANANEWADPNKSYGGLLVPPPLTLEQKAVVTKYFQINKDIAYEDPKWENYFMQQVYKGHTSPREGYSPEAYLAANGSTYLYASDYMDHLAAIDESKNFFDHNNNFNHGDCSLNETVLDNGGNANDGPFHSDKIIYMKNSTTKSFGYYNSNGSVCRTEYTGLVSYKTIMKALGSEADCLEDGWNRSFMGFDFEQMVGPEIFAKELDYSAGWSADIPGGFPMKDYIWFEWKGQKYHMLVAEQNMYCGTPLDISDAQVQEDGFIDNLLAQGYLPVTGGASKKWVKVGGCADGYYSDWIVCLTEAKTGGDVPEVKKVRVICEDMNVQLGGFTGDFDFNDAVFDLYLDENDKVTEIELLWTGAQYDIEVDGVEIHEALGVPTGTFSTQLGSYKFTPKAGAGVKSPEEIEVVAKRYWEETVDGQKKQMTGDLTLNAQQGKAPGKILVKPTFQIVPERTAIDEYYPKFKEYVKNPTISWYEDPYEGE
jgi:hypothetical protein